MKWSSLRSVITQAIPAQTALDCALTDTCPLSIRTVFNTGFGTVFDQFFFFTSFFLPSLSRQCFFSTLFFAQFVDITFHCSTWETHMCKYVARTIICLLSSIWGLHWASLSSTSRSSIVNGKAGIFLQDLSFGRSFCCDFNVGMF